MSLIPLQTYEEYINSGTDVQTTSPRVQAIADYVEDCVSGKLCKELVKSQTQTFTEVRRYGFSMLIHPCLGGRLVSLTINGSPVLLWTDAGEVIYLPDVYDNDTNTIVFGYVQDLSKLGNYFVTQCLEAQAYIWRLGEKQQIQLTQPEYLGGLKISFDKYVDELIKNQSKRIMI